MFGFGERGPARPRDPRRATKVKCWQGKMLPTPDRRTRIGRLHPTLEQRMRRSGSMYLALMWKRPAVGSTLTPRTNTKDAGRAGALEARGKWWSRGGSHVSRAALGA